MFNIFLAGVVSVCAALYFTEGRIWIGAIYTMIAAANAAVGLAS